MSSRGNRIAGMHALHSLSSFGWVVNFRGMANRIIAVAVVVACVCGATPASADLFYGFTHVTLANPNNAAAGEAQLSLEVSRVVGRPDQVLFNFINEGLVNSSITHVYFDDSDLLAGIDEIYDGSGVEFSVGSKPLDLPGGEMISFNATRYLSADSDSPRVRNGVNPGERLGILYGLKDGKVYEDVLGALDLGLADGGVDGSLRIGIHV